MIASIDFNPAEAEALPHEGPSALVNRRVLLSPACRSSVVSAVHGASFTGSKTHLSHLSDTFP